MYYLVNFTHWLCKICEQNTDVVYCTFLADTTIFFMRVIDIILFQKNWWLVG